MSLQEIVDDRDQPKPFTLLRCKFCNSLRDKSETTLCCGKGKKIIDYDTFPDWPSEFVDVLDGIENLGAKSRELNNLCNFSSMGTSNAKKNTRIRIRAKNWSSTDPSDLPSPWTHVSSHPFHQTYVRQCHVILRSSSGTISIRERERFLDASGMDGGKQLLSISITHTKWHHIWRCRWSCYVWWWNRSFNPSARSSFKHERSILSTRIDEKLFRATISYGSCASIRRRSNGFGTGMDTAIWACAISSRVPFGWRRLL